MFLFYCLFNRSAHLILIFFLQLNIYLYVGAEQNLAELYLRDLQTVAAINQRLSDRLPVTYNHLLQGGYWNMPSCRMGCDGEIGAGYASVDPYQLFNVRLQLDRRLEVSGSYRIFKGIPDPILSQYGFGDLSDKGVNIKFSLFHPEDSDYALPGIALGLEDFIGTKSFQAQYIVFTQVIKAYDLEFSLGYGAQRIRGFFGGCAWMPFRQFGCRYLDSLTVALEYDATPYRDPCVEKHPDGRESRTPINVGVKYRLWDAFDFSCSYVRGNTVAFSASSFYNFGQTDGFLPKIDDPLPYRFPINIDPIGLVRPEEVFAKDLDDALCAQGLYLRKMTMGFDCESRPFLRLNIVNGTYYSELEVRERISSILSHLVPQNMNKVIAVVEVAEGFPIQEYYFCVDHLLRYLDRDICEYELSVLSPLKEVTFPDLFSECVIFERSRDRINFELFPKTVTFFGSAAGKLKYALGLCLGVNGFLYDDLLYSVRLGWIFLSKLQGISGVDRLNPSQLPNVRTDVVRYLQQTGITLDEFFLQKSWNLSKGWYGRIAGGYFEQQYGGLAAEFLYYPVGSIWAFGADGAVLPKRTTTFFGFTHELKQYAGFVPHHISYLPSQAFFNFYLDWEPLQLDFKFKVGKFLANDFGIRNEITRYFDSGLQISIWYTLTNGHDRINGSRYYDRGIAFSMPLDIFYTYSDLSRWGYGISAWLRDVGAIAQTGFPLYDVIRQQRTY